MASFVCAADPSHTAKYRCDSCQVETCVKCSRLTATEIKCLQLSTRVLKFFCNECQKGLSEVPLLIKKICELQEDVNKLKLGPTLSSPENIYEELADRERRANNIIIYDVPETDNRDTSQRIAHDKSEASKIIDSIVKVPIQNILVFRIGKTSNENKKPRPMKVVLPSKDKAIEVLKNKKKYKKPGNLQSDLTPKQREHLMNLREELKRRTELGETDITIKYYKGSPRITKLLKN
jgi:hypothetical protein